MVIGSRLHLHRHLAAIPAPAEELSARAHRARRWSGVKPAPLLSVHGAEAFRHQHIGRLPDQFAAAVPEQLLRLAVDERNQAVRAHHDRGGRARVDRLGNRIRTLACRHIARDHHNVGRIRTVWATLRVPPEIDARFQPHVLPVFPHQAISKRASFPLTQIPQKRDCLGAVPRMYKFKDRCARGQQRHQFFGTVAGQSLAARRNIADSAIQTGHQDNVRDCTDDDLKKPIAWAWIRRVCHAMRRRRQAEAPRVWLSVTPAGMGTCSLGRSTAGKFIT